MSHHSNAAILMGIHHRYQTSGIVLSTSIGYKSFKLLTLIHSICRDLSNRRIVNIVVNFAQLNKRIKFYKNRIGRPLIVVIIEKEQEISEFQDSTETFEMGYPLWIVFFIDSVNDQICEFCRNPPGNVFRLPYESEFIVSCCNHTNLEEWWSEDDYTIDVHPMAQFNHGTIEWKHDDLSMFRRRSYVTHRNIRVALINDLIFSSFNGTHYSGLLGELFVEFTKIVHFNILPPIEEELHGGSTKDKSGWSGVIERIRKGEADLGIDAYTITDKRLNIVDFTIPLFNKRARLYMKKPDSTDISWSAYTEAFEVENWVAIVGIIIITSLLLTAMKFKGRKDTLWSLTTENFLEIWGIFCQQGLTEFPPEKSLRIVYLTILLGAMVVSAVYSGSLISFLTTPSIKMPFKSMEEFAEQTDYKFIVMRDSARYDLFADSKDPLLQKIFKLIRPFEDLPSNDNEGFRKVCDEKVAYYTDEGFMEGRHSTVHCETLYVETGRMESLAMILPRGSQYTKLLNYYLQQLRDNGILNRLIEKYMSRSSPSPREETEVQLSAIVPILVVLGGGVLLSLLILLLEQIFIAIAGSRPSVSFDRSRTNIQHYLNYLAPSKNQKKTNFEPSMRNSVPSMDYCP